MSIVKTQSAGKVYNVLFLCTGNSARSVLAESILNHLDGERFRGFSAGSHPKGEIHPLAIDLLKSLGMTTEGLRSKSWDEFPHPGRRRWISCSPSATTRPVKSVRSGPETRSLPIGGVPDPAAVEGDEATRRNTFREAYNRLDRRIRLFTRHRVGELDRLSIRKRVDDIGRERDQG